MARSSRIQPARWVAIAFLFLPFLLHAADAPKTPKPGEPTDPKAQKTFAEALDWQKRGQNASAVESFRKANKQDGGHCFACLEKAYNLAMSIGEFKAAEEIAGDWLGRA